jgi:tripartite-type tricarboxylate transporter receptor subunit TctC
MFNNALYQGRENMSKKTVTRRVFIPLCFAASLSGPRFAHAVAYPAETINFMVPYGPGGSFDSYVRKFAVLLQQQLPARVNVEPLNVPGAAGRQAIFELLHDSPDGYTISIVSVPGILMSKSNELELNKLTWIANLGRDAYCLAVGKNSNIKNVKDLQALSAKRAIKFGSSGSGSTDYFATKVFAAALGLNVRMVMGYDESPASVIAVARGDVDCVVHSQATLQQLEKEGLARILFAFQEKTSLLGVEDASSISQPDLGKIYQWRPVAAPPGLSPAIVKILSDGFIAAAQTEDAKTWAAGLGTTIFPLDYAGTIEMIKDQEKLIEKWRSVLH